MELQITKTTLSPDEVKIVESLPKVYSDLVALRLGSKPFGLKTPNEQLADCILLASIAYAYVGKSADKDFLINEGGLIMPIMAQFKDLTIEEAKKAFYDGLDNVYGDYYGLCAKTYKFFLKSFKTQINRSKAWIEFQNRLDTPKSERVVFYTRERLTEMMRRDFKDFKDKGDTPLTTIVCGLYYDLLLELMNVKELIPNELVENKKKGIEAYRNQRKGREKEIDKVVELYGDSIYNNEIKKVALRMYWDSIETLTI